MIPKFELHFLQILAGCFENADKIQTLQSDAIKIKMRLPSNFGRAKVKGMSLQNQSERTFRLLSLKKLIFSLTPQVMELCYAKNHWDCVNAAQKTQRALGLNSFTS